MKLLFVSLLLFFNLLLYGQDTIANLIPGKWALCYDTNFSKQYSCDKPFTVYEFQNDGSYIGNEVICMDKKYKLTGHWKFENGNLTIYTNPDNCFKFSPLSYYNISFINRNLFYMKGISKVEDPGQVYYYYFKRQ